jgi:uncharacterized membrane protein YeiH
MGGPIQTIVSELQLPNYVHLAAFFLFGLTGGLAAVKRQYDFIGLFAMAFATAAGGGLIRDGLFIQNGPALITRHSEYIVVIVVSALAAVLFRSVIQRLSRIIAWLDAFGLAVYAVVGVQKSLDAGLSTAAAVVVGVISASGGGLLRDLLAGEEPLFLKPGQFYALAALAGCMVYALGLRFDATRPYAAYQAMAVTFAIRVLAIQFNWSTAPVSRWDQEGSGAGGGERR